MARASCTDCSWSETFDSLGEASDAADRHERKEVHSVRIERAATDGGWPEGDPCPECGELMDVGAVGNPGETITWQECEDCGIGWGPFTGFVDLEEDDDQAVATDGGAQKSEGVAMTNNESHIRLGSVVIEKAENKPLRIVERAELTAADHPYIDVDDPANRQWGVEPDDVVYDCVYLTTAGPDDSTRPPKDTYAFAEGRLYRYHCEAALPEDARRVHTQIIEEFLADVFTELLWHGADDDLETVQEAIVLANARVNTEVPTEVLVDEADELARATLGGGGESDA